MALILIVAYSFNKHIILILSLSAVRSESFRKNNHRRDIISRPFIYYSVYSDYKAHKFS